MMTETETETHKDEVIQKPGTLLKHKRESLGLTQKQVADKLRLRVTVIQSLEDNNFNLDKVSTFVRGYLKSYARVIGLDEQVIVTAYEQFCGAEQQEVAMTSFSNETTRQQHNSRINLITFGIIVIVIGISSLWWYQNQKGDTLLPGTASHSDSFQPSSDTVAQEQTQKDDSTGEDDFTTVKELSSANEMATDSNESASADSAEQKVAADHQESVPDSAKTDSEEKLTSENNIPQPAAETAAPQNAAESAPHVEPVVKKAEQQQQTAIDLTRVSMAFKDDCWIRVKDANNKTLAVGLKKAGRTIQLQGKAPFSFILGAPESVSIRLAGEPVDLSRYTSGKVARFTLP